MSDESCDRKEKYFVCSSAGEPQRIFFDKERAFETLEFEYVDEFDQDGYIVRAYMRSGSKYITDF